ncbi:MAG: hypothetical protein RLY93_09100 [Sumerlaeia bacterium]
MALLAVLCLAAAAGAQTLALRDTITVNGIQGAGMMMNLSGGNAAAVSGTLEYNPAKLRLRGIRTGPSLRAALLSVSVETTPGVSRFAAAFDEADTGDVLIADFEVIPGSVSIDEDVPVTLRNVRLNEGPVAGGVSTRKFNIVFQGTGTDVTPRSADFLVGEVARVAVTNQKFRITWGLTTPGLGAFTPPSGYQVNLIGLRDGVTQVAAFRDDGLIVLTDDFRLLPALSPRIRSADVTLRAGARAFPFPITIDHGNEVVSAKVVLDFGTDDVRVEDLFPGTETASGHFAFHQDGSVVTLAASFAQPIGTNRTELFLPLVSIPPDASTGTFSWQVIEAQANEGALPFALNGGTLAIQPPLASEIALEPEAIALLPGEEVVLNAVGAQLPLRWTVENGAILRVTPNATAASATLRGLVPGKTLVAVSDGAGRSALTDPAVRVRDPNLPALTIGTVVAEAGRSAPYSVPVRLAERDGVLSGVAAFASLDPEVEIVSIAPGPDLDADFLVVHETAETKRVAFALDEPLPAGEGILLFLNVTAPPGLLGEPRQITVSDASFNEGQIEVSPVPGAIVPGPEGIFWVASEPVTTCDDLIEDGLPWFDPNFPDCGWTEVTLPDAAAGALRRDRFYRGYTYWDGVTSGVLTWQANGGLELFINGTLVPGGVFSSWWGGECGQTTTSGGAPVDVTQYLQPGFNSLAVHVSSGSLGNRSFDLDATGVLLPTDPARPGCPGGGPKDRLFPAVVEVGAANPLNGFLRVTRDERFQLLVSGAAGDTLRLYRPDGSLAETWTVSGDEQSRFFDPEWRLGFWRLEWTSGAAEARWAVLQSDLADPVLYASEPDDPAPFGYFAFGDPVVSVPPCGAASAMILVIENRGALSRQFEAAVPSYVTARTGLGVSLSNRRPTIDRGRTAAATVTFSRQESQDRLPLLDRPFAVEVRAGGATRLAGGRLALATAVRQSDYLPPDGATLASAETAVSWLSASPSQGTVFWRLAGADAEFQSITGPQGTIFHHFPLPGLIQGQTIEWFARSETACQSFDSSRFTFTVGSGVALPEAECAFVVRRGYDARPLLEVTNTSTQTRQIFGTVQNPNSDVSIGFLGLGSEAFPMTLAPGESNRLTLAVHSARAARTDYRFAVVIQDVGGGTLHACPASLTIDEGEPAVALALVSTSPDGDSATVEVRNTGTIELTDLSIAGSGRFDEALQFWPQMRHVRLMPGEARQFQVFALPQALSAGAPSSGQLVASAFGASASLDLTLVCTSSQRCVILDDVIVRARLAGLSGGNGGETSARIELPPGFDAETDVTSATLFVTVSPESGFVHGPHDFQFFLNDSEIALAEDSEASGRWRLPFDPMLLLVPDAVAGENRLRVRSNEPQAHLELLRDMEIALCLSRFEVCVCAPSNAAAREKALALPFVSQADAPGTLTIVSPKSSAIVGAGQWVPIQVASDPNLANPYVLFSQGGEPLELLPTGTAGRYEALWRPVAPDDEATSEVLLTVVDDLCTTVRMATQSVFVGGPVPRILPTPLRTRGRTGQLSEAFEPEEALRFAIDLTNDAEATSPVLVTFQAKDQTGAVRYKDGPTTHLLPPGDTTTLGEARALLIPADEFPGLWTVSVEVVSSATEPVVLDRRDDFWPFQIAGAVPGGTLEIVSEDGWTSATSVLLAITASPLVDEMRLRNGAEGPWGEWQPLASTAGWELESGDGQKTVCVQFRSVLDLLSPAICAGIGLDTTPPGGTLTINGGDAFTRETTVSLTIAAEDPAPGSGLRDMRLRNQGAEWGPWRAIEPILDWRIPDGAGGKTVEAQFRDRTGLISAVATDAILPTFDKVILVAGGGSRHPAPESARSTADFLAANAFERGFSADRLRLLSAFQSPEENPLVHEELTRASLQNAITTWGADAHRLTLVLLGHGQRTGDAGPWSYFVNATENLNASELNLWLDIAQDPSGRPTETAIVAADFSFSGGFVPAISGGPGGRERVVLTSTSRDRLAVTSADGALSYGRLLANRLLDGEDWKTAHDAVRTALRGWEVNPYSTLRVDPWLDDNGDGSVSDEDGVIAAGLRFGRTGRIGLPDPFESSNLPSALADAQDVAVTARISGSDTLTKATAYVHWTRTDYASSGGPLADFAAFPMTQAAAGEWTVTLPASAFQANGGDPRPGTYAVLFAGEEASGASALPLHQTLRLGDARLAADAFEAIGDSSPDTTENAIPAGASQRHTLHHSGDADWLLVAPAASDGRASLAISQVRLPAGARLRVRVWAGANTDQAPLLTRYALASDNVPLAISWSSSQPASFVAIDLCQAGSGDTCNGVNLQSEAAYRVENTGSGVLDLFGTSGWFLR